MWKMMTLLAAWLASGATLAQEYSEPLKIIGEARSVKAGAQVFERRLPLPFNRFLGAQGVLQPAEPVPGVVMVTEIELLAAFNDPNAIVVDTREIKDRVKGTIPGSVSMPYTEIVQRMGELGCRKPPQGSDQWDCSQARIVYGFCSSPVCPFTPTAIRATTRAGFPAANWRYYRGGMLTWEAVGLPVVEDDF